MELAPQTHALAIRPLGLKKCKEKDKAATGLCLYEGVTACLNRGRYLWPGIGMSRKMRIIVGRQVVINYNNGEEHAMRRINDDFGGDIVEYLRLANLDAEVYGDGIKGNWGQAAEIKGLADLYQRHISVIAKFGIKEQQEDFTSASSQADLHPRIWLFSEGNHFTAGLTPSEMQESLPNVLNRMVHFNTLINKILSEPDDFFVDFLSFDIPLPEKHLSLATGSYSILHTQSPAHGVSARSCIIENEKSTAKITNNKLNTKAPIPTPSNLIKVDIPDTPLGLLKSVIRSITGGPDPFEKIPEAYFNLRKIVTEGVIKMKDEGKLSAITRVEKFGGEDNFRMQMELGAKNPLNPKMLVCTKVEAQVLANLCARHISIISDSNGRRSDIVSIAPEADKHDRIWLFNRGAHIYFALSHRPFTNMNDPIIGHFMADEIQRMLEGSGRSTFKFASSKDRLASILLKDLGIKSEVINELRSNINQTQDQKVETLDEKLKRYVREEKEKERKRDWIDEQTKSNRIPNGATIKTNDVTLSDIKGIVSGVKRAIPNKVDAHLRGKDPNVDKKASDPNEILITGSKVLNEKRKLITAKKFMRSSQTKEVPNAGTNDIEGKRKGETIKNRRKKRQSSPFTRDELEAYMNEAVPAKAKRPKKDLNRSIQIDLSLDKKIEQDGYNENEKPNQNQFGITTRVGFKALNSNRKESKTATPPGSDNLQPAKPTLRARRRIEYAPPISSDDEADDTLFCKRFKSSRSDTNIKKRKDSPKLNGDPINNNIDAQMSARPIKKSKWQNKYADLTSTDGSDFEDEVGSNHKEKKQVRKKKVSKSNSNKLTDLAKSSKNSGALSAKSRRQSHSTEDSSSNDSSLDDPDFIPEDDIKWDSDEDSDWYPSDDEMEEKSDDSDIEILSEPDITANKISQEVVEVQIGEIENEPTKPKESTQKLQKENETGEFDPTDKELDDLMTEWETATQKQKITPREAYSQYPAFEPIDLEIKLTAKDQGESLSDEPSNEKVNFKYSSIPPEAFKQTKSFKENGLRIISINMHGLLEWKREWVEELAKDYDILLMTETWERLPGKKYKVGPYFKFLFRNTTDEVDEEFFHQFGVSQSITTFLGPDWVGYSKSLGHWEDLIRKGVAIFVNKRVKSSLIKEDPLIDVQDSEGRIIGVHLEEFGINIYSFYFPSSGRLLHKKIYLRAIKKMLIKPNNIIIGDWNLDPQAPRHKTIYNKAVKKFGKLGYKFIDIEQWTDKKGNIGPAAGTFRTGSYLDHVLMHETLIQDSSAFVDFPLLEFSVSDHLPVKVILWGKNNSRLLIEDGLIRNRDEWLIMKKSCPICKKVFSKHGAMKDHIRTHTGERPFKCIWKGCKQMFSKKFGMISHLMFFHERRRDYKCAWKGCELWFSSKKIRREHLRVVHEGKRDFKCTMEGCGKLFGAKKELKIHFRFVHEGKRDFRCIRKGCGQIFSQKIALRLHVMTTHEGRNGFACFREGCGQIFTLNSDLTEHIKIVHDQINCFACIHKGCGRSFSDSYSLQSHVKTAHEEKGTFKCILEGCGKFFTLNYSLTTHIRTVHEKRRDYQCNWKGCGKFFSKKGAMKTHIRTIHEGKRDFKCEFENCGKDYTTKKGLNQHVRSIHLGLKEFKCKWADCGKFFIQRSYLNLHIKTVHEQKREFKCDREGCLKQFGQKIALKYHISSIHEKKKFKCDICGREFARFDYIANHKSRLH